MKGWAINELKEIQGGGRMKASRKAINALIPSITYIRQHYTYGGQTGWVPAYSRRIKDFIIYDDAGKLKSWLSGYGDAMPRDLYYGNYTGANVVEIIEQWMRGNLTRAETVAEIQTALLEDEVAEVLP